MSRTRTIRPAPFLLEIGCEEIPPRMIPEATSDLALRVVDVLDRAGLDHRDASAWGGSRRLAVLVDAVASGQPDRDELVVGPPARVAFDEDGRPTRAAVGFANKQGVDPGDLERMDTDKGAYAGFRRAVRGRSAGEVLAERLPAAIEGMSFPKSMRWGDGRSRWVRPVHWIVALHGAAVVPVEVFGTRAGAISRGHRFLGDREVALSRPGDYADALERAHVIVDPARRRDRLREALERGAESLGGVVVDDPALLEEVADLVEWPGVVAGRFDAAFLELPRELLTTTLRHHQKCFAVRSREGALVAGFLAVANTDRDPAGHVRRGNEWVVVGRLEDARFFWNEDRKKPLSARADRLADVTFHAGLGSYADKAARMAAIAESLARRLGLTGAGIAACREAARLAKNDLVTSTVGEFPELQGRVGGLMLAAEGAERTVADAVYAHYRPQGPQDALPPTDEGCVVAVADKLDSLSELIGVGEKPTGSRDPFGLRRAASGVFRIVIEREWPLSIRQLAELGGARAGVLDYLRRQVENYLRDTGFTSNEILAVLRPRVSESEASGWPLGDIVARLGAIRTVRERPDFEHLVDLTKRVDNILSKDRPEARTGLQRPPGAKAYVEEQEAARHLEAMTERHGREIDASAGSRDYARVVDLLSEFVGPVERFFEEVLVMDPERPGATAHRCNLLAELRSVLTRCFDVRELAGQADRRT